jgi:hypothetical protein
MKFAYAYLIVVFASVTYASLSTGRSRFAEGTQLVFAFVGGFVGSGAVKQIIFEFASQGHVSDRVDACAVGLLPDVITVCVLLALGAAVLYWAIAYAMRWNPHVLRAVYIGALIALFATGAQLGVQHWSDYQIARPCL